jgi:hypothetical protein
MFMFLLVVGLIAYLGLAAMFMLAAWNTNSRAKWLGLAAIAAAAPGLFWMGAFAEQFGAGQCYTAAVHMIANAVERTDSPKILAEKIRVLPMHGYETFCSEVEAAARALPNATAP